MTSFFARLRTPFLRFSVALHVAGLIVVAIAPHAWLKVFAVLFASHLVALVSSMRPRGSWVGPNASRQPKSVADVATVGLTLDDGPDPTTTPQVLEILREHGAYATFFCIGRKVDAHPDVAAAIVAAGHRVENHTYHHSNLFSFSTPWGLTREIERAQQAIERTTGRRPSYFRAPAGVRNPWLDWVLAGAGLSLVSWSRRAFDTCDRDVDRIVRRVTRNIGPGDVMALHDAGCATGSDGRPVILSVLPKLLAELARRGLAVTAFEGAAHDDPVALVSTVSR